MTSQEAKEVLVLYRSDADRNDPDFAPALEQLLSDPELKGWFDQHCAIQKAVLSGFDQVPVPEGLKEQILSERKAHVNLGARRKARVLVLAAIPILLLIGFMVFYSNPPRRPDFSAFRLRMAGKVLRDYPKMDLETADLGQIRQYLAEHGGQKDYSLPPALEKTRGRGCAIFDWRGKKISMLCFNSGKNNNPKEADLFLFIVDRSAVREPAATNGAEIAAVKRLSTASWTSGDKTYLLAASGDERFLREYH